MTDAHLPGRWLSDPRSDRLSDQAFRTFSNALTYAAEQGTDGFLERRALRWVCPEGDLAASQISELVAEGFLLEEGDGAHRVAEWERTQSSHAQVEAAREQSRVRKQRSREKAEAAKVAAQATVVTRHVTRDA